MKCVNCGNEILIQVATNIKTAGGQVLTNMTTIITVRCDKCKHVFQVPVSGKSVLSVKKDN